METLIHHGIKCNVCQKFPIVGIRYKCIQCKSYDLCEQCERKFGEKHGHLLLKLRNNEQIRMMANKYNPKEKEIKLKSKPNQKLICKCVSSLKFKTVNNNNSINIPVTLINEGNCNWPLPCFFCCDESLSKIKGNRVKISKIKGEPGEKVEFNIKLDLSNIKKTGNYPSVWNLQDENGNILSQNVIFFISDIFKDKLQLKPLFKAKKFIAKASETKPIKNYDYLV